MSEAKIGSKDLAAIIVHTIKFELNFKTNKAGNACHGSLSKTTGTDLLNMELHMLHLQWLSRPLRSHRYQIKLKHNVEISVGKISN